MLVAALSTKAQVIPDCFCFAHVVPSDAAQGRVYYGTIAAFVVYDFATEILVRRKLEAWLDLQWLGHGFSMATRREFWD